MALVGVLALAGLAAAIAVQALAPPGPTPTGSNSPSSSLPADGVSIAAIPPPVLDAPKQLTRESAIDIGGHLSGELPTGASYRLLVYVNDRQRREVKLDRRAGEFSVANVPLAEGSNAITVAVGGPADRTAHSAPVTVERDTSAPSIDVDLPGSGAVVYGPSLLLSGTTEALASVTVMNSGNGAQESTSAGAGGEFSVLVSVRMGDNQLQLTATDAAGNLSRRKVTVSRQESRAAVSLTLSRDTFDLSELPQPITIMASVLGHDGLPLDGADVTFSISAPGQMTVTRQVVTVAGSASWSGYPLTPGGAQAGRGLVTVLVTLPDGQTLAGSAAFSYR